MSEDLPEIDLTTLDLTDPLGEDVARHTMLGVMTCAQQIGLHEVLWDAIKAQHPKWEALEDLGDIPEHGTLEYDRLCDIVEDAVPIAEGWLRDWIVQHDVPYVACSVVCPAHGAYVYTIGQKDKLAEQEMDEGLTLLMPFGPGSE